MTDQGLLMFGIGITFIFAAGVYVYLGERFARGPQEAPRPTEPTRSDLRDARSET